MKAEGVYGHERLKRGARSRWCIHYVPADDPRQAAHISFFDARRRADRLHGLGKGGGARAPIEPVSASPSARVSPEIATGGEMRERARIPRPEKCLRHIDHALARHRRQRIVCLVRPVAEIRLQSAALDEVIALPV